MDKNKQLGIVRQRRRFRVRKSIRGTPERPRLSVYRSNQNVSVQVIDDSTGRTLVAASSLDADLRSEL